LSALLASLLLWTLLRQESELLAPTVAPASELERSAPKAKTITAQVSEIFQADWRLLHPALRLCKNCLAQSFSYYLKERQALAR
jgi:hypothetical protein